MKLTVSHSQPDLQRQHWPCIQISDSALLEWWHTSIGEGPTLSTCRGRGRGESRRESCREIGHRECRCRDSGCRECRCRESGCRRNRWVHQSSFVHMTYVYDDHQILWPIWMSWARQGRQPHLRVDSTRPSASAIPMEIMGRMWTMKGTCPHVRLGSGELMRWVIIQVIQMLGPQRREAVAA